MYHVHIFYVRTRNFPESPFPRQSVLSQGQRHLYLFLFHVPRILKPSIIRFGVFPHFWRPFRCLRIFSRSKIWFSFSVSWNIRDIHAKNNRRERPQSFFRQKKYPRALRNPGDAVGIISHYFWIALFSWLFLCPYPSPRFGTWSRFFSLSKFCP